MARQGQPQPSEYDQAMTGHGPLEASAPEYNPQHTTVAVQNWEEAGEVDPSGQTRLKARYLPPSPRGPGYSPPMFGQEQPGSPVAYPRVYGATADVTVGKQPSKEEAAFEEGSDIPPGTIKSLLESLTVVTIEMLCPPISFFLYLKMPQRNLCV